MGMTLLQTVNVGSGGQSTIDFNNIAAVAGADLKLVISGRTDASGIATEYQMRLNGDSSSVYHTTGLAGDGGTIAKRDVGPTTFLENLSLPKNGATANTFGSAEIYIHNFSSATTTGITFTAVGENNATESYLGIASWYRDVAEPITSISVFGQLGSFMQHSTASLYLIN